MTRRRFNAALAALSLAAPVGAGAQFRQTPMVIRLPQAEMDVLAGNLSAASAGDELLLLQQGIDAVELRPGRNLLRRDPSSFPVGWTPSPQRYRAGYLSQAGGDDLADVATATAAGVGVVFGSAPAVMRTYTLTPTDLDSVASFLRLLPKPPSASGRVADVLVVPICISDSCSKVLAVDFDAGAIPATPPPSRSWITPDVGFPTLVGWHEAFPVRVSAAARAAAIDDVAIGIFGGVLLLAHASIPAAATLASLDLAPPVLVGGFASGRPPWLPTTVGGQADALGVAAVDLNHDGAPDLVFTHATAFGIDPPDGSLIWVEGTGDPADFAIPAVTPWHDLGIDPALQLVDPLIVRGLDVGGEPSFAVWDRDLQEIVVVTPDAAAGQLRVWRAPAPGGSAVDIRLADLVGSPAPDLVVAMRNLAGRDVVLVYPDTGDASPALAWAQGSPGAPARGVDHAMAVLASDADGPVTVEWMIGDPEGAPVSTALSYTHPGASLCGLPPPDLAVTVRATDDLGVFTELGATLPVALLAPAIAIVGADPPGRLVLPPGGTSVALRGTAAMACGATTWGGNWPPGATFVDDSPDAASIRRMVFLAEATYPDLLAGTTVVTLSTTDPVPDPVATLTVALDATGLVDVGHESDRPALAEGEVAVLTTRVRSLVGVALPGVRIVDVLAALAPAGPPRVAGATVAETRAGGAEVIVDLLPPAPAEVVIELPVLSAGGRGASSVEVRSSGDHLLTPPARATGTAATPPGCGCRSSGEGALALLAVAALARPSTSRPRRRRGACPEHGRRVQGDR